MEFDDKFTPTDFDHTALKKDMNSWVWTQGFGSLPILQRDQFSVAQSHAIFMYINDIALMGTHLSAEQRAVDLMFVNTWTDMLGSFAKYTGDKDLEALKKASAQFLGGLDSKCPSEGFVHGRCIPSIADVMIYSSMVNKNYSA
jgi:hypothetical protein